MTLEIINYGQIAKLILPEGWTETEIEVAATHTSSLREFSSPGEAQTRLCFYYRGFMFGSETGNAFKSILAAAPHILTAKELNAIAEILEDVNDADVFKPLSVHTQNLNGKTVLTVEGRWLQQDWDTYSLYVCADETGCAVQQIYFLAPTSNYPKHIKDMKQRLNSLEWLAHGAEV